MVGQQKSGGLNIMSEAFNREVLSDKPSSSQSSSQQRPNINVNALTFNPTEMSVSFVEPISKQLQQSVEVKAWQDNIDRIINDAKARRVEIRFEDLIEDPLLKQISSDDQKAIRFICNNTGTSTFDKELEKA